MGTCHAWFGPVLGSSLAPLLGGTLGGRGTQEVEVAIDMLFIGGGGGGGGRGGGAFEDRLLRLVLFNKQ